MPEPAWEDLSAFFADDEFAVTAGITRGGDQVAEVLGIFDDPNEVARLGDLELDHPVPRFLCPESAVTGVKKGDVATIEGKDFDIIDPPQLDGTGLATLVLAKPTVTYNA